MTSTLRILLAAVALATSSAFAQKLDEIPFFAESVGTWKGTGESLVGPAKNKLAVADDWKAEFAKEGTLFVQAGKVILGNGGSFSYRWIYRFEGKQLIGLYEDSNKTKSIALVKLSDDKKGVGVSPSNGKLEALKAGLFSNAKIVDGKFVYHAELRGADGTVNVKSKVTCVKQ